MSLTELPIAPTAPSPLLTAHAADQEWLTAARRARQLSWASLVWMSIEGIVGLAAGLDANSLSLMIWAASSFVEGLASVTVIWRFTGTRVRSATSERTAQRWVAGSFLLLVPFFLYESIRKLAPGSDAHSNAVGIAVTASAIILMPALGRAKMRLARRLNSAATAGEGTQNLMCAAQAAATLAALIGAGVGLRFLDPIAALVVSAIAVKECVALWRGDGDDCCAAIGFSDPSPGSCCADKCDCCRAHKALKLEDRVAARLSESPEETAWPVHSASSSTRRSPRRPRITTVRSAPLKALGSPDWT
jgi:hypothetical protein